MAEWYYAKDYQQVGPVSEEELSRLIASGGVQPDDLVWTESMTDWAPVREVFELPSPEATSAAPPDIEEAVLRERPTLEQPRTPPWQPSEPAVPETSESSSEEGVAPTRGAAAETQMNPLAVASLVLSILGAFGCGCFLVAIPGVICGHIALKQMNLEPNRYTGRGIVLAGLIIGYVAIALWILTAISRLLWSLLHWS